MQKNHPEIYSIITTNQTFYEHSCEHLLNIGFVKTSNHQPREADFELAINIVNRALDYIKFSFCRLDLRDTLPGIPGIVANTRYSFFIIVKIILYQNFPYLLTFIPYNLA